MPQGLDLAVIARPIAPHASPAGLAYRLHLSLSCRLPLAWLPNWSERTKISREHCTPNSLSHNSTLTCVSKTQHHSFGAVCCFNRSNCCYHINIRPGNSHPFNYSMFATLTLQSCLSNYKVCQMMLPVLTCSKVACTHRQRGFVQACLAAVITACLLSRLLGIAQQPLDPANKAVHIWKFATVPLYRPLCLQNVCMTGQT